MQSQSDIDDLYKAFGGDPSQYREIVQQEKAMAARSRWPVLAEERSDEKQTIAPAVDANGMDAPSPALQWPPMPPDASIATVAASVVKPLRRGSVVAKGSSGRWWLATDEDDVVAQRDEPTLEARAALPDEPIFVVPPETAVESPVVSVTTLSAPELSPQPEPEVESEVEVEPKVDPVIAEPVAATLPEPEVPAVLLADVPPVEPEIVTIASVEERVVVTPASVVVVPDVTTTQATSTSSLKGVFARLAQAPRSSATPPGASTASK